MNILGIKFAPLNVPLERRLQTLAAGACFITLLFGGLICLYTTYYLLFYTQYSWLVLIYLMWIAYDRDICKRGGRKRYWLRNLTWWKYFCNYFPLSIVKTDELTPDRNYILALFPHGLLCTGMFGNFATDVSGRKKLFPGITPYILTLDIHLLVPFFREFSLGLGGCSVSKKSILYLLDEDKKKGKALLIPIGGAQEAMYSRPGVYKLILKNRRGFIKLAIQTGTPIVPVFTFGENELFDQVDNPPGSTLAVIQNKIRKVTGIAPCIPIGRGLFQYSFGFIPRRSPVITVVGSPIEVVKNENPTNEEIEILHSVFVSKLTELFEKHKYKYIANPEDAKLIII